MVGEDAFYEGAIDTFIDDQLAVEILLNEGVQNLNVVILSH